MPEQDHNRWRCLTVGCNPLIYGEEAAENHRKIEGHRVAKWPVRSKEGQRRARERNRTGYYDKYNVGAKHATVRLPQHGGSIGHPFSPEALGQD